VNIDDFNLNISKRVSYDEILNKNVKSITIFTPSNETQQEMFKEYINYFDEKKKAGVVVLRNNM
jgi:hypothetical protein